MNNSADNSAVSTAQSTLDRRVCGWTLVIGAALSVLGMLHHPSGNGHGVVAVQSLIGISNSANAVHAFLMVVLGALVFGFTGLTARLGWATPSARAAFIVYAAGAMAMLGAAVINGFAITRVAHGFAARGVDDPALIDAVFSVLWALSETWAQVAVGGQGIAIALWSAALLRRNLPLALLGAVVAVPTLAGMAGVFALDVHGYLGVVIAQALWTIAVGYALLTDRL